MLRTTLAAGVTALLTLVMVSPAVAEECSQAAQSSGACVRVTTTLDSSGVTVGANGLTPGTPGSATSPSTRPPTSWWSPPPPREPVLGTSECEVKISGYCRASSPAKNSSPEETPPTPPSTLSDLVGFSPGSPQIRVEPGGWSIPRVPTNVFAAVGETREMGELLGYPIEILFQPVRYEWTYGDGARATLYEPGSSWGARQFSATPTSHVYARPGNYPLTLRVGFSASYRFDDGAFESIPGLVWRDSGARSVTVLTVSRGLVESGCAPGTLVRGKC
jgi:hypothetical protein